MGEAGRDGVGKVGAAMFRRQKVSDGCSAMEGPGGLCLGVGSVQRCTGPGGLSGVGDRALAVVTDFVAVAAPDQGVTSL